MAGFGFRLSKKMVLKWNMADGLKTIGLVNLMVCGFLDTTLSDEDMYRFSN